MQWAVRLEAGTSVGEVKTTELVTPSRPEAVGTLAEVGLAHRVPQAGRRCWTGGLATRQSSARHDTPGFDAPVVGDGLRGHPGKRRAAEVEAAVSVLTRMLGLARPSCVRVA